MPNGPEGIQPGSQEEKGKDVGINVAEAYEHVANAMRSEGEKKDGRAGHLARLIRALNYEVSGLEMPDPYPSVEDAYKQYLDAKASGEREKINQAAAVLTEVASVEIEST